MDEAKKTLVKSWFIKAHHDLKTAQKLSRGEEIYLDTAIYHCQQAAEKAMKGFLFWKDQTFAKTHDIQNLMELALPYEQKFLDWLDIGEKLTPYSVEFRYPDEVMEPSQQEFEEALLDAENFFQFVNSLLPVELRSCP